MNILSLFRRRPAAVSRPLSPAEARQQQAAMANLQAQSSRQAQANAQPGAARPRRDADGRQATRPAYLATHGVEKSFGGRMVVNGVTIYV
ncbi:MAG: hypothetical protein ACRECA_12375, partial [Pseudolabrys sp.]